jgi:hypothetical protein
MEAGALFVRMDALAAAAGQHVVVVYAEYNGIEQRKLGRGRWNIRVAQSRTTREHCPPAQAAHIARPLRSVSGILAVYHWCLSVCRRQDLWPEVKHRTPDHAQAGAGSLGRLSGPGSAAAEEGF